jgi:biuret amidohydrolase
MRSANGLDIPVSLDELLDPAKTALLVYDMQVGIRSQIEGGDRIIEQVGRLLETARQAGVRTFFTRHLSLPLELMGAAQYRTAMTWQRTDDPSQVKPWFLRDSPGFAIVPELAPRASEAVFDKITMSAFEGTPLAMALRDCGVRSVVLAGIALEIGIEPTARHAADLGIVPIVVRDACGHGNAEAAQRTIAALSFLGDAMITDVESVQRAWQGQANEIEPDADQDCA